jgi:hypothetical protein
MLRSVIAHVSVLAMLLHLTVGHCAHHLPACEEHGHEHADEPSDAPAHDDCHESHASAVMSQPAEAPAPAGDGLLIVAPDAAIACAAAACRTPGAFDCPTDPLRPLPLRAHLRLGVLLN